MKTSRLHDLLEGERLVAVEPAPAPRVEAGWFRRLNYHTGRHLTDRALTAEQTERAGRLALLGQAAAPGVVQGLEAALEEAPEGEAVRRFLQVFPGVGLTLSGEDVLLSRPLRVPVEAVPVLAVDAPAALTGVYIVLLQPAVAEALLDGDGDDPCEIDLESRPFDDEQLVDAARLRLLPWPADIVQPAPSPTWRNALAYAIFEFERQLGPGAFPPWLAEGVPLGLLALPDADAPAGTPAFLDRGAVVRTGGHFQARRSPLPRPAGTASGGNPALWQARFEQWVEHIGAVDPATVALGLTTFARRLPPLGVLPPHLIEVRGDDPDPDNPLNPLPEGEPDFLPEDTVFPSHIALEAAPVPLEDLDDLHRVASPQAPIDLQDVEFLQVLVPVPEAFYDPRLLVVERVDQAFHDAINLYLWRHADRLAHRDQVQDQLATLAEDLTGERPAPPDDPDAPAEDPEWIQVDPPEDEQDPLPAEADYTARSKAAQVAVAAEINRRLTPAQRLRLYNAMVPIDDPVRADFDIVADIDLVAANFFHGLGWFIEQLDKRTTTARDQIELGWFRLRADLFRVHQQLVQNVVGTRMATSPAVGAAVQGLSETPSAGTVARFGQVLMDGPVVPENQVQPPPPPRMLWRDAFVPDVNRVEPGVLLERLVANLDALPAAEFQAPLSARLDAPIAVETSLAARTTKTAMFDAAVTLHTSGIDLSGLRFPGFGLNANAPDVGLDFADLAFEEGANNVTPDAVRRLLVAGAFDALPGNDESAFFAGGVRSLEHVVGGLRHLDTRLADYRAIAESARKAFAAIQGIEKEARARLTVLEDLLAEVRHDLAVARALRFEEWERLRTLNQRRRQIINDHVPFLIFRRPLSFEAPVAPPRREVLPGNHRDPLPDCLNTRHPVPEALGAMLDLLREAPAGWFRHVPPLLDRLDRLEVLVDLLKGGLERAKLAFSPRTQPIEKAGSTGSTGKQIQTVFTSQFTVLRDLRATTALNPAVLSTWQNARREALQRATLGDLIDPRHGRPQVATQAATELERITRVAACLHARFREIPAVHRLRWIDDISQFDDAVDLRDLSVLEGFGQVGDRFDRRDLQALVDWLHGRMSSEPKAVALMNAVIRVALLVASHAPTHALVTADLVTPRPALVGTRLILKLDVTRVRVGMIAQLLPQQGTAVGHGIIEDLSDGVATVRVERAVTGAPLVYRAQVLDPDQAGGFAFGAKGLIPT